MEFLWRFLSHVFKPEAKVVAIAVFLGMIVGGYAVWFLLPPFLRYEVDQLRTEIEQLKTLRVETVEQSRRSTGPAEPTHVAVPCNFKPSSQLVEASPSSNKDAVVADAAETDYGDILVEGSFMPVGFDRVHPGVHLSDVKKVHGEVTKTIMGYRVEMRSGPFTSISFLPPLSSTEYDPPIETVLFNFKNKEVAELVREQALASLGSGRDKVKILELGNALLWDSADEYKATIDDSCYAVSRK